MKSDSNPIYKGEVYYFTIPTVTLEPPSDTSKKAPHTNLVVKLNMVGTLFDSHLGTVTVPLDQVFSGRNVVIGDYEIDWADQQLRTRAEKACTINNVVDPTRTCKLHMTLKFC